MNAIILPQPLSFEWDKGNEDKNSRKHGVSQAECEQAFADTKRTSWGDAPHSRRETRYVMVGAAENGRILFIAFTVRGFKLRVISARAANKRERNLYL